MQNPSGITGINRKNNLSDFITDKPIYPHLLSLTTAASETLRCATLLTLLIFPLHLAGCVIEELRLNWVFYKPHNPIFLLVCLSLNPAQSFNIRFTGEIFNASEARSFCLLSLTHAEWFIQSFPFTYFLPF